MTDTGQPQDLPGLDPDEFVGEPPAGEDDPGSFESGDQQATEPGETTGSASESDGERA